MRSDRWLIDTSAYVRLSRSVDLELWSNRIDRGLVRITSLSLLGLGYSARDSNAHSRLTAQPPAALMPIEYFTPDVEARAVEVQGLLAQRGHHRAVSVPDLLLAAAAERAGLRVLHVDKDFELIADVTGQAAERLQLS